MGIASASCVLLSCVVISGFGGALAYSTESFSEIDPRYSAVTLYVPDSYDPTTPTPLLVALHGYGSSGSQFEAYVKFLPRVDEYGFLYAIRTAGSTNPARDSGTRRTIAATSKM